ncbi:response regulator transcription factor [Bacillus sp. B-jedd]|uniref:response regulator transcription factor n=1 Tax=Bacillus sp. B-jedd TaxID=1476857 RepID=UPI00051561B3|nr:response regulator transcription factor [Bacillus sp. B-jedd]CEG27952.1 winged helix family two component transcriptional regulator [Bacillus sp. B-jedd]
MKKIVLIDDEQRMLDLLALYLVPRGYNCLKYTSPLSALAYLETGKADLVILDVMMPEMDGWEVCGEIRRRSDTPIIMLTARTQKADIVKGLKIGADDYISKPFDEEELLARIEAVLRRKNPENGWLTFHGLELNQTSFELYYKKRPISLTPKEFALLGIFLQNRNKVFTRDHLLSIVWGFAASTEDRTVDSHVRNLRDKLRKAGFPIDSHLSTVWGVGYKWTE